MPYNYDQPTERQSSEQPSAGDAGDNGKEEPDEPHIPNPHFVLPSNMATPDTLKVHAIIEKTAKFIAGQGAQMEILIKAKQANNPLFEFLNQSSHLNPYYKHMLQTMKDGKYPEESARTSSDAADAALKSSGAQYGGEYYSSASLPRIHVPVLKYKPSADCAYTQLISKIKGVPIKTAEDLERLNTPSPTPEPANGQPPAQKKDVEVKKISSALMLAQCYGSGTDTDDDDDSERATKAGDDSQSSQSNADSSPVPAGIQCPPPDHRVIIDKTAAYVLKNGKDFEQILRAKDETRFSFLNYTDPFHKYYIFKVTGAVAADAPKVPSSSSSPASGGPSSKVIREHLAPFRTLFPLFSLSFHFRSSRFVFDPRQGGVVVDTGGDARSPDGPQQRRGRGEKSRSAEAKDCVEHGVERLPGAGRQQIPAVLLRPRLAAERTVASGARARPVRLDHPGLHVGASHRR